VRFFSFVLFVLLQLPFSLFVGFFNIFAADDVINMLAIAQSSAPRSPLLLFCCSLLLRSPETASTAALSAVFCHS